MTKPIIEAERAGVLWASPGPACITYAEGEGAQREWKSAPYRDKVCEYEFPSTDRCLTLLESKDCFFLSYRPGNREKAFDQAERIAKHDPRISLDLLKELRAKPAPAWAEGPDTLEVRIRIVNEKVEAEVERLQEDGVSVSKKLLRKIRDDIILSLN